MLETKMNELLANYEVLLHKLQTYHWYVNGADFFEAHVKLEEYYDEVFEAVDEIAETLLMAGGQPLGTVVDFSKNATIEEAKAEPISSEKAFKSVLSDFELLLKQVLSLKSAADEEGSALISAFADGLVGQLSKNIWMLKQKLA